MGWADAQPDGRPAEYRRHHLLNAVVWLTPTARVPCSNAANIGERKTWMQSEFCTWQNSAKCIYSVQLPAQETAEYALSDGGAVTKPRRETR